MPAKPHALILVAEDDDDDFQLMKQALEEARVGAHVLRVRDGEELLDCLLGRGGRRVPQGATSVLVLLDLNMPRMDGREALRELRSDPALRRVPVVVLTNSKSPEDVRLAYDLGANGYVHKPVTFTQLAEVVQILKRHWLETLVLPPWGQ